MLLQTQEYKTLKGRSNKAVYAACIFVAGKRESSHRTFKEICAVMGDEVDKVDIGRCFTAIDKCVAIAWWCGHDAGGVFVAKQGAAVALSSLTNDDFTLAA